MSDSNTARGESDNLPSVEALIRMFRTAALSDDEPQRRAAAAVLGKHGLCSGDMFSQEMGPKLTPIELESLAALLAKRHELRRLTRNDTKPVTQRGNQ